MAVHVARGEEVSAANPVLDLWVVRPGTGLLAAPAALSFKIVDWSTGSAVEVQPWTALDLVADRAQAGRYAARWTPGPDHLGRHEVRWRAQLDVGGPLREIRELFDVLAGEVAFPYPEGYALVSDLRAEGVTGSDYALQEAIHDASRTVEQVTGRHFVPTWVDALPVGHDGRALRFVDPVISLYTLHRDLAPDGAPELVDADLYSVLNRHVTHASLSPDDRTDPRVELRGWSRPYGGATARYGQPLSYEAYRYGAADLAGRRYLATGLFGYTDPDGRSFVGVTPRGIVDATKRLAIMHLVQLGGSSGSVVGSGAGSAVVKSERTRDQSVEYDTGASTQTKAGTGAIGELTGDAATDQILSRYVRSRVWLT
jgi:hypothetical protein